MEQLNFFEANRTRKSNAPNGCDLWIRNSVNPKTGVKVKYIAMSRAFAVDRGLTEYNEGEKEVNQTWVHVAIDPRSRVLIADVKAEDVGGEDAVLSLKGRSKTAFYLTNSHLVDAIVNEFKLDTSASNHYFKLTRDGVFHQYARYTMQSI
jgi:hypothetical protein